MARIEHRHRLPSLAADSGGIGRLPVAGRLFLALAGLVAALEVWPIASAWSSGVTELVPLAGDVLPGAFRSGAMVALPAAVLWARARTPRTNPMLWKGALLVAVVELARVPADVVQRWLIDAATSGIDGQETLLTVVVGVLGLLLAVGSTLGIWALGEGLRDAGARLSAAVAAVLAVAVVTFVILVFGPSVEAGVGAGVNVELVLGLVSVVVNALFLYVLALLAASAIRGALLRLEPPRAWAAGAIAGLTLALVPVLSLLLARFAQVSLPIDVGVLSTALRVGVYFGWPLIAVALAAGMGAWVPRRAGARRTGYRLSAPPSFVETARA